MWVNTESDSEYVCVCAEKPAPRKRLVAQPRPGFLLEDIKMESITPIPYDIIKEGLQQ